MLTAAVRGLEDGLNAHRHTLKGYRGLSFLPQSAIEFAVQN